MDSSLWNPIGEGGSVLRLNTIPSQEDLAHITAFGSLTAIYLIHMQSLPPGMSIALIQALIDGVESVDDVLWIRKYAPGLAERLDVWPQNDQLLPITKPPPTDVPATIRYDILTHLITDVLQDWEVRSLLSPLDPFSPLLKPCFPFC